MPSYYLISNGAIASGPHAVNSPAVKRATSCGNPEALPESGLIAAGLLPEVRASLGDGQGYGTPVIDGQTVSVPAVALPPPEPVVPQQVPARLALRLLLRDGWFGPAVTTPDQLNATVEGFLAQSLPTADARNAAVFDWRRSAVFMHGNPLIRAMLPALGKTLADLDALMIEADEIRVAEEGAG